MGDYLYMKVRLMSPRKHGAVFFDRDGCLNDDIGYLHEWPKFRWLPGAIEAVRLVNQAGFLTFVVTNQSGVARGLYSSADVDTIHQNMAAELARHGAWITSFRHCPHHPGFPSGDGISGCQCRKPLPGMVSGLMKSWSVDPGRAFMVGDRETDVGAAEAAGIAGFLIEPGNVLPIVRRELRRMKAL